MKTVALLLGIHNHQPVGNFEEVFEEAYQKSYRPFAEVLLKHHSIKWTLHCTGILWEWLEKKHPEYLDSVRQMVDRKQVELMSGAFYEPILPVLPEPDKIGQILKLNQYLKEQFKVEPQGMWCAERVWEPHLPKPIREAHIQYTVLDDSHFLAAGLSRKQLLGYYRVEEQTSAIDIFPISQELRYALPFSTPEVCIEILRRCANESQQESMPALVMADDGEKFGMWPQTFKLIYQEGWLEKFLTLVQQNGDWIQTQTFSEYRQKYKPLGRTFLPTASYFEMSEWSLPTDAALQFDDVLHRFSEREREYMKRFLKGGFWRNFLAKYPESNSMYKKMLRVSEKTYTVSDLLSTRSKSFKSSDTYSKCAGLMTEAFNNLWAGQCNCAYWHGVFGGLYLPVLRNGIYRKLITAERILDEIRTALGPNEKPKRSGTLAGARSSRDNSTGQLQCCDFDGDGNEEIILETPAQNLYFSPKFGGTLFEWDFKPADVNLINVLSRRPEPYHEKIKKFVAQGKTSQGDAKSIHDLVVLKEESLGDFLSYDWYRRASLIDHFFHPGTTQESFSKSKYGEQGDFVLGSYAFSVSKKETSAKPAKPGEALKAGTATKLQAALNCQSLNDNETVQLKFFRNGVVWVEEQKREIIVEKIITLTHRSPDQVNDKAELEVSYRISNPSDQSTGELWFGPEFNFAFSVLDQEKDVPFIRQKKWVRIDPHHHWKVSLDFSDPADGMVFPLETVSNSESGFEKTFQGLTVVPNWRFSLEPRRSIQKHLNFRLEKL